RLPLEIGARQLRRLVGGERFLRDRVEAEPRRQHQAFLRAADGDVDAPFVVAIVMDAQRGNGVDQQQRGMLGAIERLADRRHRTDDAGRGLAVNDHDGFDGVALIGGQPALRLGRVDRMAPIARHELDLQPMSLGHDAPQRRELPGLEGEHLVARRQRVEQRGFPGAGARGGKDRHRSGGLEQPAHAGANRLAQLDIVGPTVIDDRVVHRASDAIGNVARSGDVEEMAAAPHHLGHGTDAPFGNAAENLTGSAPDRKCGVTPRMLARLPIAQASRKRWAGAAPPRAQLSRPTRLLAKSSARKGRRSSAVSPTPMKWIGRPNLSASATSTPPFAVPSSFVMTRPVTPIMSRKVWTCACAFCPTVASSTSSTASGADASAFFRTRTIFCSSAISPALLWSRPAVSISSTSAPRLFAAWNASKARPAASAPSSRAITAAPLRSPQILSCSTAAARKVSAAAITTVCPASA